MRSLGGGSGRFPLPAMLAVLVVLVVLLEGIPVPAGPVLGTVPPPTLPARGSLLEPTGGLGSPGAGDGATPAGSPAIPGSEPSQEPSVDAGDLATQGAWARAEGHPAANGSEATRAPLPVGASPIRTLRGSTPTPQSNNGTVTGYVRDSASGMAIDRAAVALAGAAGGCYGYPCPSASTDYRGYFAIPAAPGTYTVSVSAANYSENDTSVTVFAGAAASVGTIGLEKDGVVTGTLEGDDAAHEPLGGFLVTAASRNSAVEGGTASTGSNGTFRVEAPPVADRIDFTVPSGAPYEANHTFVFPAPGQTVRLGVVYLLRATELNITVLDRVTHRPIGPDAVAHVFTCQQRTTACPIPPAGGAGPSGHGPNETAYAVPGPTVLHLLIVGYVVNVTPIGDVPAEPAGTAVRLSANVTPMGAVELTPDLTGGNPTLGGSNLTLGQWWKYVNPNTNVSGAVVCSLDGITVAIWSAVGIVPDPCVPNALPRLGGVAELLGPPMYDWVGIGSAAGVVPLFENMSWVNLTSDRVTQLGDLNLTPGAYLGGEVYVQGTSRAPAHFSVEACSTDEPEICGPVESYSGSSDHASPNASVSDFPTGPTGFCVSAPPGPVELTVSGSGSVTGTANTTWAYVPFRCCVANPHALGLWNATDPHVASINLTTGTGTLTGRIVAQPGAAAPPLGYVEVEACLVSASSNPPCDDAISSNGTFSVNASLGWNQATVTASGFQSNSTWIDVTGANTTGSIELTPLALLMGRVVTSNGTGVLGAVLQDCPIAPAIASQPGCSPIGTSGTGSGGFYSGPIPGGSFPSASYQIIATASGFAGNWTWVNVTPGALIVAPTIVLLPVGSANAPSALPVAPRSSNGSLSTWVEGVVEDAATSEGIPGVSVNACSLGQPPTCVPFSDSTSTGGEFNASLGLGSYELSVGIDGYLPSTIYVNATGLGTVDVGGIRLTPYPWVAGRVAIAPWASLTLTGGLGPDPAGVDVCTSQPAICGPTGILSTAGFFNVSAPVGASDGLFVNASGGSPFDGLTGAAAQGGGGVGWVSIGLPVDVTMSGASVGLGGARVPSLSIYSAVTGTLYDGSTYNATTHRPGAPARWASVTVSGPDSGADQRLYISGGGEFTAFLPPNETVKVVGSGVAFLGVAAGGISVPASAGLVSAGAFELPHYGWVTTRITSSAGAPLPFASMNASVADPTNHTRIVSSGSADGDGFVNLSAPPGSNVTVQATGGGYSGSSIVTSVEESRTSPVVLPGLRAGAGEILLRSASVNTVSGPVSTTLRDAVTGRPVPNAAVSVTDGAGNLVDLPTESNGLGQFLLAVSVEPLETLGFVKNGYATNSSDLPTPAPAVLSVRVENLTGDGVVAGEIAGLPAGRGVAGANVTACPSTGAQLCTTVETNGGGAFWLARPPGAYLVTVAADDFDSNISVAVTVCSDCFTSLGAVALYGDAIVTGTIIGDSARLPIEGATVTLCPTNGSFFLQCAFGTITDGSGNFRFVAPVGAYTFSADAPSYGPVSFPVDLAVGEPVEMGLVALPADGGLHGTVVTATTGEGIANATILACPTGSQFCDGTGPTGPSGTFAFPGLHPGPTSLTVTATNFTTGYASITIVAGDTVELPPVALWPLGVTPHYALSGVVEWNASGAPVDGAFVAGDLVGGGVAATMVTGSNGTFSLALPVGAYEIVTTLAGARPVRLAESVVSGPVEGVLVRLYPETYQLHGIVSGSGADIALGGILVRVGAYAPTFTGSDGSYGVPLPNGTYMVGATPTSGAAAYEFRPQTGSVKLNGASAILNLLLPERTQPVGVRLLDAATGLGLPGIAGAVAGSDVFGVRHAIAFATDPNGSAALALPIGSYSLFVNASGFVPLEQPFELTSLGANFSVGLAPVPSSPSTSLGPSASAILLVVAVDGGALVVALATFWFLRRRRARADRRP